MNYAFSVSHSHVRPSSSLRECLYCLLGEFGWAYSWGRVEARWWRLELAADTGSWSLCQIALVELAQLHTAFGQRHPDGRPSLFPGNLVLNYQLPLSVHLTSSCWVKCLHFPALVETLSTIVSLIGNEEAWELVWECSCCLFTAILSMCSLLDLHGTV